MNLGKECETIEFKESTSELKEGIRSIASMLNKKPTLCALFRCQRQWGCHRTTNWQQYPERYFTGNLYQYRTCGATNNHLA